MAGEVGREARDQADPAFEQAADATVTEVVEPRQVLGPALAAGEREDLREVTRAAPGHVQGDPGQERQREERDAEDAGTEPRSQQPRRREEGSCEESQPRDRPGRKRRAQEDDQRRRRSAPASAEDELRGQADGDRRRRRRDDRPGHPDARRRAAPSPARRSLGRRLDRRRRLRGDYRAHARPSTSSRANQRPSLCQISSSRNPAAPAIASISSLATKVQGIQSLTSCGLSSRTRLVREAVDGGSSSTRAAPPSAQQPGDTAQQRGRVAADADVAVEQERGVPDRRQPRLEDRALDDDAAALAGERCRVPGELDPDRLDAQAPQRDDVAAGTAADVEDRTDGARSAAPARRPRVPAASARAGAGDASRRRRPRGIAPAALPGRIGRARARRPPVRSADRLQTRAGSRLRMARANSPVGMLLGDQPRVVEVVDVTQLRQLPQPQPERPQSAALELAR